MNEQTNKSKLSYPLAEKDCTRAKLSQGEKLQNLLDVEAAEGEVNTAPCSTCCLERPLTQMPRRTHLRAGSWHLRAGGQGTPPMPWILPVAPADAESHDGIIRTFQSQRWLQNQRAKHQIQCSESLPDDLYLLCEEEREAETCSRCPCASELHGGLQEVMLRFQANLRLICSFVDMYASGRLWIIRWYHFPRTDDNQYMNKFIHSYQYKSRF